MSLKAKIEAVIYASEEPVTLQQFVGLLGGEAQAELDAAADRQGQLQLAEAETLQHSDDPEAGDPDALNAETLGTDPLPVPAFHAVATTGPNHKSPEDSLASTPPGAPAPPDNPSPLSEVNLAAKRAHNPEARRLRDYMRSLLDGLIAEYRDSDRGLEIREIAGGFRFATKPEFHDAVRGFVRSLKPPLKLSLQALETLAVVAYKQPVTAPEVSEIRGVDSAGVLGSLMGRKLVATAGRKQVIGRPILYKTTREFLVRFGLKDVDELPGIEEFERLAADMNEAVQEEIAMPEHLDEIRPGSPVGDAARNLDYLEPMRDEHAAQADGIPEAEPDAEGLTPAPDTPGEFTGDETVPPTDNASIDGRLSGVPPTYDQPDAGIDSPALDAEIQNSENRDSGGSNG